MTKPVVPQTTLQIPMPKVAETPPRSGAADLTETIARALYDLEPFYMPAGQMVDGAEVCRKFAFEDAPAYRVARALEQAATAYAAIEAAGFAVVPMDVARKIAEADKFIEEAREEIRAGARPAAVRFKL
jgi:hypothetical protein